MRHSIARALVACLTALLTYFMPADGLHRRAGGQPNLPTPDPVPGNERHTNEFATVQLQSPPERQDESDEDGGAARTFIAKYATMPPAVPLDLAIEEDPSTLVRWYVVLAESAAWLEAWKAEREAEAVRNRRAQAEENGDGFEECWDGCPCRKLPTAAR